MIERLLEWMLFSSRWLLAPMFLGLAVLLAALTARSVYSVYETLLNVMVMSKDDLILDILGIVDLTLIGALIVIVIFSGYENFVSRIDTREHRDWPEWMGKIDFTGLKLKLLSSIVAISGIHLLRSFMNIGAVSDRTLIWEIGIHMAFVVSGLVLALTDWMSDSGKDKSGDKGSDRP